MFGENWEDYRWMEDVHWTYKTNFSKPSIFKDEKYFFNSKGIDYKFEILLNGKQIFADDMIIRWIK